MGVTPSCTAKVSTGVASMGCQAVNTSMRDAEGGRTAGLRTMRRTRGFRLGAAALAGIGMTARMRCTEPAGSEVRVGSAACVAIGAGCGEEKETSCGRRVRVAVRPTTSTTEVAAATLPRRDELWRVGAARMRRTRRLSSDWRCQAPSASSMPWRRRERSARLVSEVA